MYIKVKWHYQNERIYTVRCTTYNTLIDVGSTTMPPSPRLSQHKTVMRLIIWVVVYIN